MKLRFCFATLQLCHFATLPRLIHKAILDQRANGGKTVLPRDLLALVKGTPVVADRHFKDRVAALENFGGQLGFDLKTAAMQRHLGDDFFAETFVTGFHVAENGAIEQIGDPGEQLIAQRVAQAHG